MGQYLIGLDNGGSDIKCAVFDLDGNEIAVAGMQVPMDFPRPGFTERDVEQVWKANVEVIREALKKANSGSAGKNTVDSFYERFYPASSYRYHCRRDYRRIVRLPCESGYKGF